VRCDRGETHFLQDASARDGFPVERHPHQGDSRAGLRAHREAYARDLRKIRGNVQDVLGHGELEQQNVSQTRDCDGPERKRQAVSHRPSAAEDHAALRADHKPLDEGERQEQACPRHRDEEDRQPDTRMDRLPKEQRTENRGFEQGVERPRNQNL
jgi:hypothetical protein